MTAYDDKNVEYIMAELRAALTRAKWAQRKLSVGVRSGRVERLGDVIIEALQLAGEIRAAEVRYVELLAETAVEACAHGVDEPDGCEECDLSGCAWAEGGHCTC